LNRTEDTKQHQKNCPSLPTREMQPTHNFTAPSPPRPAGKGSKHAHRSTPSSLAATAGQGLRRSSTSTRRRPGPRPFIGAAGERDAQPPQLRPPEPTGEHHHQLDLDLGQKSEIPSGQERPKRGSNAGKPNYTYLKLLRHLPFATSGRHRRRRGSGLARPSLRRSGLVDPPFVRNIQLGGWSIPCSLYNQTNLKQG
jgi:hypothetical protein